MKEKIKGTENKPALKEKRTSSEIEKEIAELEQESGALSAEIIELEKKLGEKTVVQEDKKDKPKKYSRRAILKWGAMAALAIATKSDNLNNVSNKKDAEGLSPKIKERAGNKVEQAKEIIREKKYEQVLENSYLVSALYYSDAGVERMSKPYKTALEEIVSNIHPLITKEFRENYIAYLKRTIEAQNKDANRAELSRPLKDTRIPNNLGENHLDAIDLFTKEGSHIYAVSGGIVVLAENGWKKEDPLSTSSERGGNTVIIFNPHDESFYRYAHMETAKVSTGKVLLNGEKIGVVGHTGTTAAKAGHGEHLHFEINRYDRQTGKMLVCDVFELKNRLETAKSMGN